jgi:hypothetical protein
LVHADGDDPLDRQETMSQLNCERPTISHGEKRGGAISLDQSNHCSNQSTNLQISKSQRFVGCSIVRCEPQISKEQERRARLKDCEYYLRKDSRFRNVTEQAGFFGPGPERTKIVDEFWKTAYSDCYLSEVDLIRARGRVLAEYIALLDEEYDRSGLERQRCYGPSHVVEGGGDAQKSGNSSQLECERSYRPSHVEVGGGDALQVDQVDRSSPGVPAPYKTVTMFTPTKEGSIRNICSDTHRYNGLWLVHGVWNRTGAPNASTTIRGNRAVLTAPYGVLPRKCSFYLFILTK